ncbi:hypothetical protein B9Q03_06285 [Candidatus Marsarchaeota G2 archaeon OSP_D]|jgi:hypothetical protein|nr:MAG: hypothetical protein B9Q03_06285 [Candidatus Marsarchaeota G2 archaeon OSP_D]PSN94489.1 MAG: hypothetical protein B9Q09_04200 [Candidatus Marsarchaeota G2 archaeon ECH_B_SAG-C16]PSO06662.1 MAG: hypothetical protein B9Q04_14905 [Candidatus Marsarchaeota G2 archaeon BE_D]
MNKWLTVVAGLLALIGLIINVVFDRDNIYDMYAAGLWLLTLIFAFLGAFMGGGAVEATPQQPKSA